MGGDTRKRFGALVVVVGLVIGTAACGGSPSDDASPVAKPKPTSASPTPTPTPTPTPPPAPPPPPPASLLSGKVNVPDGQVLAVKVDNVGKSLPHVGLTSADVVYLQQVEGGVSRMVAVYSSQLPGEVGPIRSARITDLDLLAQYGAVAFAFSGANGGLLDIINASPLKNVSDGAGYYRKRGRPGTHDLFGTPAEILSNRPDAPVARDVGFRFGPLPAGGRPAAEVRVPYPRSTNTFGFDPASGRWLYWLDGRPDANDAEGHAGGTTLIVQYTSVSPTEYRDSVGSVTPFMATVGSGTGVVLRDGQAFDITWERPVADGPTRYLFNGADMPLAPGQVWVVLQDAGAPVSIS